MSHPCRYTHHSLGLSARLVLALCQAATRTVASLLTSLTNRLLISGKKKGALLWVMIHVELLNNWSTLDFTFNPLLGLLEFDISLFSTTMDVDQLEIHF